MMISGKKVAYTSKGIMRGVYGRMTAKLLDNRPVVGDFSMPDIF